MKKEKNTNHEADNQSNSSQLPEKSKADILTEELDKIFTERGLEIEWGNQTGSFVYFPKSKISLKATKKKEEL